MKKDSIPTDETIVSSIDGLKKGGEQTPCLTFIHGPRIGQLFALEKKEIVIGRSPDCDLWIEDSAISRKHFKVVVQGEKIQIKDLGSTNGTYVNGNPVKESELNDGDKIQISRETILEFNYLDESSRLSEKKRFEMGVMDPVTNIYNKRYFLDRLREEFTFARRKKRNLSIIMFDLDHFKELNDTYGHLAGDLVLQKLCSEISKAVRSDDIFARYGGEEFVIVMRDTDVRHALELAERIRLLTSKLIIPWEDKTIKLTISCGVAAGSDKLNDFLDLVAEADKCLYESKNKGRNRVSGP